MARPYAPNERSLFRGRTMPPRCCHFTGGAVDEAGVGESCQSARCLIVLVCSSPDPASEAHPARAVLAINTDGEAVPLGRGRPDPRECFVPVRAGWHFRSHAIVGFAIRELASSLPPVGMPSLSHA